MKKIRKALVVTMSLVGLACAQPSQSNSTVRMSEQEFAAQVESLIDKAASEDSFSGAVLVAKDGKAIFEKAAGFANKETKLPNKIATKFNLGSINKSFTNNAKSRARRPCH